jgi:hypothetical protein
VGAAGPRRDRGGGLHGRWARRAAQRAAEAPPRPRRTGPAAQPRAGRQDRSSGHAELAKAFAYRASRFEGFKIACYQASDRGFFGAHRDNLSPATTHRRFALTLNLNDGYQGGQLRFPEYGPELYRPAPGAALLFSCSHLHEVLEVTAGRRFVLLSFLFGEEAPGPK